MSLNIINIENFEQQNKCTLRLSAKTVNFPLNKETQDLIDGMKSKLYKLGGVGLAAPQVDVNLRVIAVYIPKEAGLLRDNVVEYPMHIMINPKYTPLDGSEKYKDYEACYSVSSIAGEVPRFEEIHLDYYDVDGKHHETIEGGFYARVLQHEIDHLDGVLITDRFTSECTVGTIKEITAMRRNGLSEDKKKLFDDYLQSKFAFNDKS